MLSKIFLQNFERFQGNGRQRPVDQMENSRNRIGAPLILRLHSAARLSVFELRGIAWGKNTSASGPAVLVLKHQTPSEQDLESSPYAAA
jgi:hypothetical protein